MPVASSEKLVGTNVGRYRLEKILGEGGMGCVYLGVDGSSRVAIKVLSKQTDDSMQRFRAEARAVSLISHFNIVNLVDVAELPDGRPYMVMELVEGQSLRDVAPTATVGSIVRICCEVLAALEAAHAIGIVHRDLKPDNIMVTKTGHAKVLDFGVAKLAPGVGGGNTPRTKEGLTMGTPAYMAPEQVVGNAVDARTDVYTMGVVLFEALTGQRPFAGSDVEVMRAHRDKAPPKPRTLVPTIPATVEDVIMRALAKDPAKRYASAHAMANALVDAAEGRASAKRVPTIDDTPTVGGKKTQPAVPAQPSRLPAMIAVAVIAIAATVVFTVARARRNAHHTDAPADAAEPEVIVDGQAIDAEPTPEPDAREIDTIVDAAVPADAALARDAAVTEARPVKPSLPAPITHDVDFNPDAFEPLAYLARATQLAQQLAPDAQLYQIQAQPLTVAKVVELSRIKSVAEYRYISAAGTKATPIDNKRPCVVVVSVTKARVEARVETDSRCAMKPVRAPRCSVARLRDLVDSAYSNDATRDAELDLVYRGRWIIVINFIRVSDRPTTMELPDC